MAVFFWRRTTTPAAITSIVLGTAITVAWRFAQGQGWSNDTDSIYPALIASVASLILVSLFTPKPDPAKCKPFSSEARELKFAPAR
jgi:SSS family solute:Na+ symporter/sodium/proline symporter